jgi:hypothetical protein
MLASHSSSVEIPIPLHGLLATAARQKKNQLRPSMLLACIRQVVDITEQLQANLAEEHRLLQVCVVTRNCHSKARLCLDHLRWT